jgi:hypothetical protein
VKKLNVKEAKKVNSFLLGSEMGKYEARRKAIEANKAKMAILFNFCLMRKKRIEPKKC